MAQLAIAEQDHGLLRTDKARAQHSQPLPSIIIILLWCRSPVPFHHYSVVTAHEFVKADCPTDSDHDTGVWHGQFTPES